MFVVYVVIETTSFFFFNVEINIWCQSYSNFVFLLHKHSLLWWMTYVYWLYIYKTCVNRLGFCLWLFSEFICFVCHLHLPIWDANSIECHKWTQKHQHWGTIQYLRHYTPPLFLFLSVFCFLFLATLQY